MKASGRTGIERLLSISSDALAPWPAATSKLLASYTLGEELFRMLQLKNGFYAFEASLHVFPLSSSDCVSLEDWNSDSLWRSRYLDLAAGLLFFAEDVFQDQFCLSTKGVLRFNSECGTTSPMATSIEDWAEKVVQNYSRETGWLLASKWQKAHGPLPLGKRLLPKIPFCLGGAYSLDNLWAGEAVAGMRFKADLAIKTKDLPEGSQVRFVVGKEPKVQ
jgi:hypothetical protein